MKTAVLLVFLLGFTATLGLRMKRDHAHGHHHDGHDDDDHSHDHHHHDHDHDEENKIDSDGLAPSNASELVIESHESMRRDLLDHLRARWSTLEIAVCGPKAGEADELIDRHHMQKGDDGKAQWRHGTWVKSEVTTKSEDLGTAERAIFSGGHKLLEGDAILPWFRMTKSAVLLFWHRGGNVLVHSIAPDGTHNETLLGDELFDTHASYDAMFPPNTWLALENESHGNEATYSFITSVLVPGYKHEYKEKGTEDLVNLVGEEHAAMVKRLLPNATKEGAADDHHHGHHGHDSHDH